MAVAIVPLLIQEEKSVFLSNKSRKLLISLPSTATFSLCARHRKQPQDTTEEAVKKTDLSAPPDPSVPPLQSGGVMTGKIKGEKQRVGGGIWPGSWALCCHVSLRDKSWLFIGLSVSPAFYWGGTTLTQTWGTGPNGVLNRLGPAPRHCQSLPWVLVYFRFKIFAGWLLWPLFLLVYKSNFGLNNLLWCWEEMPSL